LRRALRAAAIVRVRPDISGRLARHRENPKDKKWQS
jgi:hypothetical protein